jgi:multidrug efflux system outer membrane protein
MKLRLRILAGSLFLLPTVASAQPAPDLPDESSPSPGTSTPAPLENQQQITDAPGPVGGPTEDELKVDDPMLAPVPPPKNILQDWREALQQLRIRSPDYIRAQAQVEVARGQSRMALAHSLPALSANAQVNHHLLTSDTNVGGVNVQVPDPATRAQLGGTLRIPVLSARNWYDYSTSKREIERSSLTLEDAERLIIGGLAESIVGVVTAERLAEVTRVNLAAALSTLELNRRRARLGSGSELDVLRAKQEATRSRAQVVEGDETLREAREALGLALGYSEPWGVAPDLKMDRLRQDARDTCTQGSDIKDRADVRAANAGAAIAQRNLNSVMYSHLPTVDLNSSLNYYSWTSPQSPDATWTIGASLTWHLYEGGLRTGETQLNEALLEQTKQNTIEIERNARLEVQQTQRKVGVAGQSLEIAQEARAIAQDHARLARTKFINGTGTSFDMVDTQTTARQSELDVTLKEFQLLRAEIIAFLALASCEL